MGNFSEWRQKVKRKCFVVVINEEKESWKNQSDSLWHKHPKKEARLRMKPGLAVCELLSGRITHGNCGTEEIG